PANASAPGAAAPPGAPADQKAKPGEAVPFIATPAEKSSPVAAPPVVPGAPPRGTPPPAAPREGHHEPPRRTPRGRRVRAASLPAGQSADVGVRLVARDLRPSSLRIRGSDSHLRHLDLHGNR